MKKFKYFEWNDPYKGWGVGPTLVYIEAESKEEAKNKLMQSLGFRNDPDFISGDVEETDEFIQPQRILVL